MRGRSNPLSAAALLMLQIAVGGTASLHMVWCLLGMWTPTPSRLQEPLANAILNGGSILRASTRPLPEVLAPLFHPLGLALGSPIFPSGCEGKLGLVKNPPAMQETQIRFLGQEDALEKG